MLYMLPTLFVLGPAAFAAGLLALNRRSPPESVAERSAAARALSIAVVVQAVHFAEEAATGFTEQLGATFGLPGIPFPVFLVFNLA